jgi:hypothetical protein
MIDLRHGIARIGYVLLIAWEAGWILFIAWGVFFENPDWSNWPTSFWSLLGILIGYPLAVFLLWRLLLWLIQGFARSN